MILTNSKLFGGVELTPLAEGRTIETERDHWPTQ